MNASAYLHNQGWRGEGYSLDRTDRGLAKPLLVAHKTDLSGLGNKKNDFANQWWTTAFDKSLKDLGNENRQVQSLLQAANTARLQSNLYTNFVRSEPLRGTISDGYSQPPIAAKEYPVHLSPETPKMAPIAQKTSRFSVLGVPPGEVVETVPVQQTKISKKDKKKDKEDDGPVESVSLQETKVSKKKKTKEPKKEKSGKKQARKAERKREQEERKAKKTQMRQERRLAAESKGEGVRSESNDVIEDKKSKKRKRDEDAEGLATLGTAEEPRKKNKESGAEYGDGSETRGDQKSDAAVLQEPAADFISLNLPTKQNLAPKGVKTRKEAAKEIRARRKADKAAKARERVAIKRHKQDLEIAGATATSSIPDPARELRYPLHPESILALRESGQTVQIPGDQGDEDQVRYQLIKAFEQGPERHSKTVLDRAAVQFQANELTHLKATSKKAKIKREAYKRKVKTDAKRWLDIRANPHLYKSDGTYIFPAERGVPAEELRAWRQAEKEARQQAVSEKKAALALKAQQKAEIRAAKQQRRMEKLQLAPRSSNGS